MDTQERTLKVENYGKSYDQLQQTLSNCPREMWNFKPGPGGWSIVEVVVHLADIEANNYVRYRTVATTSNPSILGVDADTWANKFEYQEQSPDEALELFRLLRSSNSKLLKSLPQPNWTNKMNHSERGELTLEQLFEVQSNHLNAHINQIKEIYESWKQHNG